MINKKNVWQFIAIICISIWFWYSLVFAWITWKIEFKTTDNIFVDSLNLNKAKIYLTSSNDLTNAQISWDCSPYGRFIERQDKLFIFEINFNDKLCNKEKVKIYFEKWNLNLTTNFNLLSDYSLYSQYLDYSDIELENFLELSRLAEAKLQKYFDNHDKLIFPNYTNYLKNSRKLDELIYTENFIKWILDKRKEKYLIPIKWVKMPTQSNRLPNSWRPYRSNYTDWTHEWWDFYTGFGDIVQALDYWLIIKTVKNFEFSDLDKLKQYWDITKLDKMKNLDILRWNQVWIKTMKWDVVFYAHLNEVFDNIRVWDVILKGQKLWTVGISGVPDKEYSDYHLHLEIHKNPYLPHEKPYSLEDYMTWDWYFKGEKEKYILENQDSVFEKN
jgi:hypothetical protein